MALNKKKILLLVDWFAPGYKAGGPIQSCVNFAFALRDDFDIYVLTTDTDHGETVPYENIVPNKWIAENGFHIFYTRKKTMSLKQLKQTILGADADYVYLNHFYSPYFVIYPLWLKFSGRLKSKVVLCPRGALYDSAIAVKSFKKKPFITLFRWLNMQKKITFHATNSREKKAIEKFFPGSETVIADNLPNTDQPAFVTCQKNAGSLKCIFIARILPIKNLLFVLNTLAACAEDISFTIIGPVEDKNYWKACEQQMDGLPKNIRVNYLGPKKNNELAEILMEHHLFVLPTQGENFGHSIFESFLCGRPVLISDQTPWLRLAEKKIGWDLPLNRSDLYCEAIKQAAAFGQQEFDDYCQCAWNYAKEYISSRLSKDGYLKLFS